MLQVILFFVVLFVAILADLYIWDNHLRQLGVGWQVLHFLPVTILMVAIIILAFRGMNTLLFRIIFIVLLCVVLPQLILLCFWGAGKIFTSAASALGTIGLVVAFCISAASFYGLVWGWRHLVVRQQTITVPDLPKEFDGFRIVQVSDLHLEMFEGQEAFMRSLVDSVNAAHPDLIVFTGDLVSRQSREMLPFMDILSQMKAPYGVMSILGNHDYSIYGPFHGSPKAIEHDLDLFKDYQRQIGWDLLLNEHRFIRRDSAQIAVIGVENEGKSGKVRRADLPRAIEGVPDSCFKLLLTHDPWHWRHEVTRTTNIQLTLSGHTHAAHFRIGDVSPSRLVYSEWRGLYRKGSQQLFISSGIGGMLAFRLGAWPEINVLTLRRER
ncbi:MAG: metallophosphoesterase [Bacteroidales bacterium]|nr:metallophosphoesterase [Bacteroidales bacterium]